MTLEPACPHPSSSLRRLSRRWLFAASAAATLGTGALVRNLHAQSETPPSGGHNPFAQAGPATAGPRPLVELLAHVPQAVLDERSGVLWYYADLAQQFDAVGVSRGEDGPDEKNGGWLPALMTLATASNAFSFARDPEITDGIGFNPLGVDQTVLVGDPPSQLTLFRGGLRPADLIAAWQHAGYTVGSTAKGTSFWSIGADGEVDLEHPVQRAVFAAFNNVTLVGDVLVCAPTQALLETALAAGSGDMPSAAEQPVFGASLRTLPETTVSAITFGPGAVAVSSTIADVDAAGDDLIARSDAAVGAMPSWDGLITAVAAGAVAAERGKSAGTALVRIVTGQPYTDLMEITGLAVDDTIAMIDFEQVRTPQAWSDLFLNRDTLPFIP